MRARMLDRLQWSAIVTVMLAHEILVGLIGHFLVQAWYVVSEKIAYEWRRLRR